MQPSQYHPDPVRREALAYRGIIFDLDGTLLNTLADLAGAMNSALAANGLATHPVIDDHKYFIGDGVATYVLRVLPPERRGDEELMARLTADYRAAYAAGWNVKTRPYDGAVELLVELARRGMRAAVFSNKPDDTTRLTVAEFIGAERFEVVRGAMDGFPLKPDPAGALAIADEMGIDPAELAYVGDTATDMATAKAAGMFAIGALWGFRTREELAGAGAAALARTPPDVLTCL